MIALHRIAVENFLSLRDVDVTLRDLSVLVGPNGAGKSNLLDAIRFLGDTARLDLQPAIAARGGIDAILYRGRDGGKSIKFTVEAVVTSFASDNARDEYTLTFRRLGKSALSREEDFKFKRKQGRGRRITVQGRGFEVVDEGNAGQTWAFQPQAAGLATLPKLGDEAGGTQVRELASLFESFRVFDVDAVAARRPGGVEKKPKLAADASNLAAFLLWLSKEHEAVFALLQEDLAYVLPGFERLELKPVGGSADTRVVNLVERGLAAPTPLARASFGTVRALALLAMLHDPNPPKLTCMEEIDHGLHPYDRGSRWAASSTRRRPCGVTSVPTPRASGPAITRRATPRRSPSRCAS